MSGNKLWSRRKLLAVLGAAGVALATGSSFVNLSRKRAGASGGKPLQYTLMELKQAADLKEGMIVRTTGYYRHADGGAAEYVIKADAMPEDGGSVINLQNGLQAHLLPVPSVNYKLFGAIGDGENDDGVQIKKAHAYANREGIPVVNMSGKYWIKETNLITITTNVQWGHTEFHIDESRNSKSNPRFQVVSRKASIAIQLDAAAKASFLAKLKPGTTLFPELAAYKNCLVVVADENDRIGLRRGYSGQGWAREELFYVEEHGRIIGDIAWTFKDYTRLTAYPCDDNYLIIDGGTFYLSGDNPGRNQGYWYNGFVIKRSRTVIRNQWVGLEPGKQDVSLDARQGFYMFTYVYDVLLENVRLIPWEQDREGTDRDVPNGTYGIGGNRVLNATFRNVTAEGSNVHWGVFGTNLFKNFRLENCRLNRVDVHFHCWNLYVKDCEIGYKGFTLTGGGDLFIENTKRFGNRFIDFRQDYGAKWDGNIRLKNCRLVVTNGSAEAVALNFLPADFDYKYPIGYGRSIKVEDFIFDYTGIPNPTGICRIMKIASFSKITGTNARLFFPQTIEFANVTVIGREKGVRILEIPNPYSFDLGKPGGYDAQRVKPNCTMRFVNIQGEKVPPQNSQSTTHVNFLLYALGTAAYEDEYALYPKIDIINCGDFFGHFKGSVADVYISRCTVNGVDAYEGGPMRGRIVFDNCEIKADVLDDGKMFFSLSPLHDVTFINCTVHAPMVDGVSRPDEIGRYDFIEWNKTVRYSHINTRLSKEIVDHFANKGTPAAPEFIAMLKSHHDAESVSMAKRKGSTAERPEPAMFNSEKGFTYFDTDLGQLFVWDGARWVLAAKAGDTLHFYADDLTLASPGAAMKRAEGHPSHEYVLLQAGRLVKYAAYVSAPVDSASLTFEIWKNGAKWLGAVDSAASSSNPLLVPLPADATFNAGDRIAIRLAGIAAELPPGAYATVDLHVVYTDG